MVLEEEGENSVIYGLEQQSRALASLKGDRTRVAFLVGTQSLRGENQVCLVDYEEESHQVTRQSWLHPAGELWDLAPSYVDPTLLATVYSALDGSGGTKIRPGCGLWRMEEESASQPTLTPRLKWEGSVLPSDSEDQVGTSAFHSIISFQWQPQDECGSGTCGSGQLRGFVLGDNRVVLLDFEGSAGAGKIVGEANVGNSRRVECGAWSPHREGRELAVGHQSTVEGRDTRTMGESAWVLEQAHLPTVRSIDFNPNLLYQVATGGDDARVKLWDIRSPAKPLVTLHGHSHWLWRVRYNPVHDRFLLSASSDATVLLHCAFSFSSEASVSCSDGDSDAETDLPCGEKDNKIAEVCRRDGLVRRWEEHEESVYCCEWSVADPWLLASLSYDGRFIINKVPKFIKDHILHFQ